MLCQLMTAGVLAMYAVLQPMPASGETPYSVATHNAVQPTVVIEQILAHRSQLALDDQQVQRLQSLAADARRQDSDWYYRATRCESSKPWLNGPCLTSITQVRSAALAILTADQRAQAVELLKTSGE